MIQADVYYSTACVLSIDKEKNQLNIINVGDSGCLVYRDEKVIFQTKVQQHGFNFPFQVLFYVSLIHTAWTRKFS